MFKLLETNNAGDRRYLIGNYAVWFYPHRRMNIGQMKPIPIIRGFLYKSYRTVRVSYLADFHFFKISWSKDAPFDLTTYEGKDFLKQKRPDVDLRGNFVFPEEAKG
ncbi:MAG: hypothetical protein KBT34_03020 [Prevotella sp.]|nr:hypothetical protein [Candidatus Prevotella equi]